MEREEPEESTQTAPAEVWEQMSAEQREHVHRLLIRIACEYVETHLKAGEGDRVQENTDDER